MATNTKSGSKEDWLANLLLSAESLQDVLSSSPHGNTVSVGGTTLSPDLTGSNEYGTSLWMPGNPLTDPNYTPPTTNIFEQAAHWNNDNGWQTGEPPGELADILGGDLSQLTPEWLQENISPSEAQDFFEWHSQEAEAQNALGAGGLAGLALQYGPALASAGLGQLGAWGPGLSLFQAGVSGLQGNPLAAGLHTVNAFLGGAGSDWPPKVQNPFITGEGGVPVNPAGIYDASGGFNAGDIASLGGGYEWTTNVNDLADEILSGSGGFGGGGKSGGSGGGSGEGESKSGTQVIDKDIIEEIMDAAKAPPPALPPIAPEEVYQAPPPAPPPYLAEDVVIDTGKGMIEESPNPNQSITEDDTLEPTQTGTLEGGIDRAGGDDPTDETGDLINSIINTITTNEGIINAMLGGAGSLPLLGDTPQRELVGPMAENIALRRLANRAYEDQLSPWR